MKSGNSDVYRAKPVYNASHEATAFIPFPFLSSHSRFDLLYQYVMLRIVE